MDSVILHNSKSFTRFIIWKISFQYFILPILRISHPVISIPSTPSSNDPVEHGAGTLTTLHECPGDSGCRLARENIRYFRDWKQDFRELLNLVKSSLKMQNNDIDYNSLAIRKCKDYAHFLDILYLCDCSSSRRLSPSSPACIFWSIYRVSHKTLASISLSAGLRI
jgi:hypothetical protein